MRQRLEIHEGRVRARPIWKPACSERKLLAVFDFLLWHDLVSEEPLPLTVDWNIEKKIELHFENTGNATTFISLWGAGGEVIGATNITLAEFNRKEATRLRALRVLGEELSVPEDRFLKQYEEQERNPGSIQVHLDAPFHALGFAVQQVKQKEGDAGKPEGIQSGRPVKKTHYRCIRHQGTFTGVEVDGANPSPGIMGISLAVFDANLRWVPRWRVRPEKAWLRCPECEEPLHPPTKWKDKEPVFSAGGPSRICPDCNTISWVEVDDTSEDPEAWVNTAGEKG